jgi:diguanylate cyclase (GGDEF)-like protein/PAS domain S-box-containing protein
MAELSTRPAPRVDVSLPVVAAGLAAAAVLVFLLRTTLGLGPVGTVLAGLLTPSTFIVAAIADARAARKARSDRAIRRFWWLMGGSHVAVATGAVGLSIDMARDGTLRPTTIVPFIAATVLTLGAVVSLPLPLRSLLGSVTAVLDLAIVFGAGASMALFLLSEIGAAGTDDVNVRWLQICMAGALLGVMFIVAKIALYGTRPIDPTAMRYLAGTTIFSAALSGGVELVATVYAVDPGAVTLPLAGTGFVLAAERQRRALDRGPTAARPARPYSPMPYVALGMFNAMFVYAVLRGSTHISALVFASVVLTALVVGRQLAAFNDNARLLTRLDASLRDVRRQEHRFRALVRNSSDVIAISDLTGRASYVSPGVESLLQIPADQLLGSSGGDLVHPDDVPLYTEHLNRMGANPGTPVQMTGRFRHANGSWRWLEILSTNLVHDPDIEGVVSNIRDVTEARTYQEELSYQASHDELTGLINRTLFVRTTDQALTASTATPDHDGAQAPERTVVLLVDLDDFKTINDRLGHTVGDALLAAVGSRLRGGVRPEDTVARLGGDEFAVLLRDVEPTERMDIARRIIGELEMPFAAGGHELLVRASVGVAPGSSGADAAELLRRADLAMYVAKGRGRGRCTEFDEGMDERASEHARLAADLSAAIERNELRLVYQPIVTLPAGDLAAVEALVRWTHPVRGAVSPAEFVPVAERTGLIVQLGAWILYEACQQGASWMRQLGPSAPSRISVNVSARQLAEPDFPDVVEQALLASGLPAERLTVEITETAVFDGGPALQAIAAMRALGVRIALDDFGTGHSSLGLLRTCPIDVLKVDKSFVDGVGQSVEQEAIVTSLSQIGTAMRLQVIAEGVETGSQADRLHELGYRFAQGFHFARPLPPKEIEAHLMATV